jgi:hypothetical protein
MHNFLALIHARCLTALPAGNFDPNNVLKIRSLDAGFTGHFHRGKDSRRLSPLVSCNVTGGAIFKNKFVSTLMVDDALASAGSRQNLTLRSLASRAVSSSSAQSHFYCTHMKPRIADTSGHASPVA